MSFKYIYKMDTSSDHITHYSHMRVQGNNKDYITVFIVKMSE